MPFLRDPRLTLADKYFEHRDEVPAGGGPEAFRGNRPASESRESFPAPRNIRVRLESPQRVILPLCLYRNHKLVPPAIDPDVHFVGFDLTGSGYGSPNMVLERPGGDLQKDIH